MLHHLVNLQIFLRINAINASNQFFHCSLKVGGDAPGLSGHVEVANTGTPHAGAQARLDGGLGGGYLTCGAVHPLSVACM